MEDPSNENGDCGSGVIWQLKQPEHKDAVDLGGQIVFELTDLHGSILISVSLRPETIEKLLRPHLSTCVELQLDGSVSVNSEFFALQSPRTAIDIVELVRQGLAPEMLEDEPNAAQMLSKFRDRLLKSLEHVGQAIWSLPKD
jgi:hypothetical protein